MAIVNKLVSRLIQRRALRRWRKLANAADVMHLSELRVARGRARRLRHELDRLIHVADNRLALPAIGSNAMRKSQYTDWTWRPALWRGPLEKPGLVAVESKTPIGDEATLFHDCRVSELTLRQLRNTREADLAPFGVRMDVFRFDGSFLSLVINAPDAAATGLSKRNLIRMDTIVESEKPIEIFARLNIKHGPNTEQIVRELPLMWDEVMVEFDLAYTKLNEKRIDKIWIDLIFEGPEMNQIVLRDVTFSRTLRADL